MDFSLSEIQAMLADSVEKFVTKDYDFGSRQKYAASETFYSNKVWQLFCDLVWTAIPFADKDGGIDGGHIETMILMQQFGRGLVVEPYLANIVLAGGILRRVASDAQKAKWLEPLINGDLQAALAFVEPQSRYELSNIASIATPDDDGWIINGRKGVVLNGGNANLLVIPARTAGDTTAEDGISLFAVDASTDGVTRRAYPTVDGHQAAEIKLDDVRVDATALLGVAGQGFGPLVSTIDEATLAICAEAVGIMQVLTDKTVEYTKNRVQFGVPIGTFQALQHRMVDMLTASELTLVGQEAVQLHGGMGISWELDIGHYFKRLTAISQMLGNADWHLDKLAD
jgi:alkylation response protein AidB-like acyl-CoA dehydrogenase